MGGNLSFHFAPIPPLLVRCNAPLIGKVCFVVNETSYSLAVTVHVLPIELLPLASLTAEFPGAWWPSIPS